jgi:heme/copper-type cytochrome/quinol oxidase subunit 3
MDAGTLVMPNPMAPRTQERVPPVSNTRLAMVVLLASESMLFAGLIGMFLVFRLSVRAWPPENLPRLPLVVTAINTLVLFASLIPLGRAMRLPADASPAVRARHVAWTALLGGTFVAVQGGEWARLVHHGLTLASGTYGASFYGLIGCHALHVVTAAVWLVVVAVLARQEAFAERHPAALEMCGIYWYFVCGLWGVLFPLVYLL